MALFAARMEQMQRQEDASGQASGNLTVEMTFECIGGTKLIISIIRDGTESERLAGQLEAVIGASQCTLCTAQALSTTQPTWTHCE